MSPWLRFKAFFANLASNFNIADPFGLRVYGQSLLTTRVKSELGAFTFVMALQYLFDFTAWSTAAWLVAPTFPWFTHAAAGFVFATMILLVDKFLVTMDVSRSGSKVLAIALRGVLLMMLALVTAVPLEMFVFQSEIENHIAAIEKVKVDAIREKGKAFEKGRNDALVAAAEEAAVGEPEDVTTRRDGKELDTFVKAQEAGRKEITTRLGKASSAVATEARKSAKTRSATVLADLRANEAAIRKELAAYNAQALKDLEERSAHTEAMRTGAIERAAKERAELATSLDATYVAIDAMTSEEVSTKYGGEWKHSRGFLDQYRAMSEVVDGDPMNKAIAWGCRLVMIMFGLAIIFMKAVASSEETGIYLSLRSQAASGNPEAIAALRRYGYAFREGDASIGYSTEIRAQHDRLVASRMKVRSAMRAYLSSFTDHCNQQMSEGGGRTRRGLNRHAHQLWDTQMGEVLDEHDGIAAWFIHNSVALPAWPPDWDMPDPTNEANRPWTMSDATIEERFGWTPTN